MSVPRLLWRVVEQATLDTLFGRSPGQYHIALGRPAGIDEFFAGLPQHPKTLHGYSVSLPLEAAPGPPSVGATALTVFFNGWLAQRREWRIPSQRPNTAYPLWRPGTGPSPATQPGSDAIILVRDSHDRFHARWLGAASRHQLPAAVRADLSAHETGTRVLSLPELRLVEQVANIPTSPPRAPLSAPPPPDAPSALGAPYQSVPLPTGDHPAPVPFAVDPDALDRGVRAHIETQNELADRLLGAGLTPLQPDASTPPFDIAWEQGPALVVAEVKSITPANEERQLRLGLGQVLRYTHSLRTAGVTDAQPALVAERQPFDLTWLGTCAEFNVVLSWPDRFNESFGI